MDFKLWIEATDEELKALNAQLVAQYPGLQLFVYRGVNCIHISEIRLPKEMQGHGIGTKVIQAIQSYAQKVNLPITLSPQPDRGRKAKLLKFYSSLGFKQNSGRNKDYSLGSTFGPTMVWRPR